MIKSFKDSNTAKIWSRRYTKAHSKDLQNATLLKLLIIDSATDLNDLRVPPANRLEKLTGNRADYYSIRVNKQWRICFTWKNGDAYDVELIDYH